MSKFGPAHGIAFSLILMVAACSSEFEGRKTVFGPAAVERDRNPAAIAARWDLNNDGTVTCDEWTGYIMPQFLRSDTNGDDALDATEFGTFTGAGDVFEGAELSVFDGDADGKMSRRELLAKPNPMFAHLDTDKNCQLTPKELMVVRPARVRGYRSARGSRSLSY